MFLQGRSHAGAVCADVAVCTCHCRQRRRPPRSNAFELQQDLGPALLQDTVGESRHLIMKALQGGLNLRPRKFNSMFSEASQTLMRGMLKKVVG